MFSTAQTHPTFTLDDLLSPQTFCHESSLHPASMGPEGTPLSPVSSLSSSRTLVDGSQIELPSAKRIVVLSNHRDREQLNASTVLHLALSTCLATNSRQEDCHEHRSALVIVDQSRADFRRALIRERDKFLVAASAQHRSDIVTAFSRVHMRYVTTLEQLVTLLASLRQSDYYGPVSSQADPPVLLENRPARVVVWGVTSLIPTAFTQPAGSGPPTLSSSSLSALLSILCTLCDQFSSWLPPLAGEHSKTSITATQCLATQLVLLLDSSPFQSHSISSTDANRPRGPFALFTASNLLQQTLCRYFDWILEMDVAVDRKSTAEESEVNARARPNRQFTLTAVRSPLRTCERADYPTNSVPLVRRWEP